MTNQLDALKRFTSVVADTGEFQKIAEFKPDDATTNPSLILQAVQSAEYSYLLGEAIASSGNSSDPESLIDDVCDNLAVSIGCKISELVPGLVSTEVDARLSFDTNASIDKAHKLIKLYESRGVSRDRILIKLASTWECIQACKSLEAEGIHCNMTLLFSFAQAVAAAEAGATLISPFVGRILDWHVKNGGGPYTGETDPGVISVSSIYRFYKANGFKTIVMGASFRNKDEILALAGCDKLTIAPKFLKELQSCTDPVFAKLSPADDRRESGSAKMTESQFRWAMNEDAMATEKLAEGIRSFHADTEKLRKIIRAQLSKSV